MIKLKNEIIQEAVAYTGVDEKIIRSKSRKLDNVMIRDAICVAMKELHGFTDESIARSIGRDRSSVSHIQRRHAKRLEKVPAYRVLFDHLINSSIAKGRAS